MKRSRVKPFSQKRIDDREARAALREIVVERDKVCQFWVYIDRAGIGRQGHGFPGCLGDLVPHEPGGSRNVGRLNPDESIAICFVHNQFIEDLGQLAYDVGLKKHANGYPISHVGGLTR